jgi:hypothetical protein
MFRMLAISTKLTMLVLLLPIGILAILDTIVFYAHGTLIIEFSNLLSSILVFLLVWERLRDSLSKKLEYLDDNVFLNLLSHLQGDDSLFSSQDEIRKARDDLKRHAKFMNIALYPHELLKKLNEFLLLHENFYGKWLRIYAAAEEIGNPDKWVIVHYLNPLDGRAYPPEREKAYIEAIESKLGQGGHLLVGEMKAVFLATRTRRIQIHQELEEFLKCNNLKLDLHSEGFALR